MKTERKIRNTIQTFSVLTHCIESKVTTHAHVYASSFFCALNVSMCSQKFILHTIGLDVVRFSFFGRKSESDWFFNSCSTLRYEIIKLQEHKCGHCYSNVQEVLKHCMLLSMTTTTTTVMRMNE